MRYEVMSRIKSILIILAVSFCYSPLSEALNVTFVGNSKSVIEDRPAMSTGLDAVFTVFDISEVSAIEISGITSITDLKVQIYSNLGGGYAADQPVNISNATARILNPKGDLGYIISCGSDKYCFWIVDYADKHFEIASVDTYPEQDCDMTRIAVVGKGEPIKYYAINGRQCHLDRGIEVKYNTLEWDSTQKGYVNVEQSVTYEYLQNPIVIRPPFYCNTAVSVSGDRFMKIWGIAEESESSLIHANGLDVHTEAVQTNISHDNGNSNMISSDETTLGGSAPADFTFYAYTTDAVIHNEWQIADDPEFEYVRYRFNEQDLTYTFDQEGKFYVRFIGSNDDGSCETAGDTYEIGIGASDLRIPNAFSPDGDGVNDVWKVGYRSLTEFKCWIFDRNGRQLFYFDRPELGWDGKHRGKVVSPGVYYYVIEAEGADGKKYKKGGDINILKYRKISNSSGSSVE